MVDKKRAVLEAALKGSVLYIDCETSLIELYAHCIGSKQNIGHHQIKKDKKIITICYMAEGQKLPKYLVWDKNQDDKQMLKDFVDIASKYKVIVAQNGDQFDIKVIRGRCWLTRAGLLPEITTLDTLKMSRQNFKLTSHKLDFKSKAIGREGKIGTDFQLWVDVQNGSKKALSNMVRYCMQDVVELREVFLSMLPYCAKLPHHLGAITTGDKDSCSLCGSSDIAKHGFRYRGKNKYQRYACRKCGNVYAGTKSITVS